MIHTLLPELVAIAKEIAGANQSDAEWAEVESSDMFQGGPYCGGYETDEQAFTFSVYSENGDEHWFNLTLPEIDEVVAGTMTSVSARPAEK